MTISAYILQKQNEYRLINATKRWVHHWTKRWSYMMLIFMNINADTIIIDSLAAQITKRGKDQGNIYDEDHQSQPKSWNVKHRAEMFTHQCKAREKFGMLKSSTHSLQSSYFEILRFSNIIMSIIIYLFFFHLLGRCRPDYDLEDQLGHLGCIYVFSLL